MKCRRRAVSLRFAEPSNDGSVVSEGQFWIDTEKTSHGCLTAPAIVNRLLSLTWWNGGRYRARTDDLYGVNVALCQLS